MWCGFYMVLGWVVAANPLKKTKWGDPLPQIVANISWIQNNKGRIPPRGVSYAEWLECSVKPWTSKNITGCDNPLEPPGAYLADAMFSPRRNFASLTFKDEIYVMGGRARELEQMHYDESRGGLVGARMKRWREHSVLKNDIWKSSDAGKYGCSWMVGIEQM